MHYHSQVIALCLFITSYPCHAADVKLVEVSQYHGTRGRLETTRKYSTEIAGEGQIYHGVFWANKFDQWSLEIFLDSQANSVLPLQAPESEITGDQGLLVKCLKRFMSDVPGASIANVEIELRSNPRLWKEFLEHGRKHFEKREGVLEDTKAIDHEISGILTPLLMTSSEAQKTSDLVARQLGCPVKRLKSVGESWEIANTIKMGEKLSDIASDPALGYKRAAVFNIYFDIHE